MVVLAVTVFSCILDPHRTVERTGVCYAGSGDYTRIVNADGARIQMLEWSAETLLVGGFPDTFEMTVRWEFDTALFEHGDYRITVRHSGFHGLPDADCYQCGDPEEQVFSLDATIHVDPETTTVVDPVGWIDLRFSDVLHTDSTGTYVGGWYGTTDTATFTLVFELARLVDDCLCSVSAIQETPPVIAIARHP
jgi:hypothetical protein